MEDQDHSLGTPGIFAYSHHRKYWKLKLFTICRRFAWTCMVGKENVVQSDSRYEAHLNMSGLTVRQLKIGLPQISQVYKCAWFCSLPYSEVQFFSGSISLFFSKFKVLYSAAVCSSQVLNSDCKRNVWTCIYFMHQDTLPSQLSSIFTSCTFLQHELWIIQSNLTFKQKLGIYAAIDSGVPYNALIRKYQVRKRTLTRIRNYRANISRCVDAAGTTTLDRTISWAIQKTGRTYARNTNESLLGCRVCQKDTMHICWMSREYAQRVGKLSLHDILLETRNRLVFHMKVTFLILRIFMLRIWATVLRTKKLLIRCP